MFGLSFRKDNLIKEIAPGIKCNNFKIIHLIKKFFKNSQLTITDLPEILKKLGLTTPCILKNVDLKRKEFEIEFKENQYKTTSVAICKLYTNFPNRRITIQENNFQNWIEFAPEDNRSNLLTIQHRCITIKKGSIELVSNYLNLIDDLLPINIFFSLKDIDNHMITISLENILLKDKKDTTFNIISAFNLVENYLLNLNLINSTKSLMNIFNLILKEFKLSTRYLLNASIYCTNSENQQIGKIKWKSGRITEYKTIEENAILTVYRNTNWDYKDEFVYISKTDTTYDITIDSKQSELMNSTNISELIATTERKLSQLWKWVE